MTTDSGRGRSRVRLALEERVYGAIAGTGQRGAKRSALLIAFPPRSKYQVERSIRALENAGRIYQRGMTLTDAEAWGEPWRPKQYLVVAIIGVG